MDGTNVHDLPEEQAQLVAACVAFLCQQHEAAAQERDWAAEAATSCAKDWDTAEDAISDDWREHDQVPARRVVLLPCPCTDLAATRTRRAVVVSVHACAQATGDVTVAMITSVPHTTAYGGVPLCR